MANETGKTRKKGWRSIRLIALLLTLCLLLAGCSQEQVEEGIGVAVDILVDVLLNPEETEGSDVTDETVVIEPVEGEMVVHYIDVGQADATLVVCGDKVMLFDSATYNRGDELVEYINNLGIDYIDVMVLTHPHDDHMGGASIVIDNIDIGTIYCPDIAEVMGDDPPNWFELMEASIEEAHAKKYPDEADKLWDEIVVFPRDKKGNFAEFNIGEAKVKFLAPLEDEYSDKNDYSICAIVSFGSIDIMLTGDATKAVEKALIEEGYDLDIEIFQASHHGSDTGNSREFLDAMTPECVVISCGMKNRYDHPIKSVMELYEEMELPVYRTDEDGNIVMTTDGETYSFNVEPGTYTSGAEYKEGN